MPWDKMDIGDHAESPHHAYLVYHLYDIHQTEITQEDFYIKELLHQKRFYTKQFLYQEPLIPKTFYTRNLSHHRHLTPKSRYILTPENSYKKNTTEYFYSRNLLHQRGFYTRGNLHSTPKSLSHPETPRADKLHQTAFSPDNFYTKRR